MIRIRIPATSANLGAGFDALGVALTHYNYVEMEEWDGVDIVALDGMPIPTGEKNLIYQTAGELFKTCGRPFRGLRIRQENNIPMARGLGSSSACIVAGLVGANTLLGNPLPQAELINLAAAKEGHPDNSTPALVGGLAVAVLEEGRVYYIKKELPETLTFAAIIPDFELKTARARAALPTEIPHRDGVYNLSRAALMALSLADGRYENLAVGAEDRLHQPYRLGLIPGAEGVFALLDSLGAAARYISGAGSTLMGIFPGGEGVAPALRAGLDAQGHESWKLLMLHPDNRGAAVEGK